MKNTNFKQILMVLAVCLIFGAAVVLLTSMGQSESAATEPGSTEVVEVAGAAASSAVPVVYMTNEISSEAMVKMYEVLGRDLPGRIAVKLSTGEPGGNNFLSPDLIKELVQQVNGTIVECNTAYGGKRASSEMHKQVAIDHGFTAIAPFDLLDEEGSISLPFPDGIHLKEDFVGSHFKNYDSYMVLSHFKGHAMGGFGGALKNISIGLASASGKSYIHTAGQTSNVGEMWGFIRNTEQDYFLESMAEASGAVMTALGDNVVYISVMNNLSVDCDCSNNPADPTMGDIGILASLDPVALDKACVDLVYAAHDGHDLIERMESRNGAHILEHAVRLGIGSDIYELFSIDG